MFGEHLNVFENSIVNEDDIDVDNLSDVYDSEEDNLLQYANNQPLAYQEMPPSVCASMYCSWFQIKRNRDLKLFKSIKKY